ncbi:MAG TPA: DUF5615 family PIN-like protein [Candidatus Kapabacteria bacterium]|nr:DUF5615 family PIN-like protein [Candidatus Kapabacteria bacterium]
MSEHTMSDRPMKFLIDMNLSPAWATVLRKADFEAIHWSNVGAGNADDRIIFDWAAEHGYAILTLDLDFGSLLSFTGYSQPSVIQIRREDVAPDVLLPTLLGVLSKYSKEIEYGALIVIDATKIRIRMLPLKMRWDS